MNNAQPTNGIVESKALVCKFYPGVGKVYCIEIDQPITRFKQLAQSFATAIVEREFARECDCATRVLSASKSADLPSVGLCVLEGTFALTGKPGTFTVTVRIEKGDSRSTAEVCVDLLDKYDVVDA